MTSHYRLYVFSRFKSQNTFAHWRSPGKKPLLSRILRKEQGESLLNTPNALYILGHREIQVRQNTFGNNQAIKFI